MRTDGWGEVFGDYIKKSCFIDETLTREERICRASWMEGCPLQPAPEQYEAMGKMAEDDYFEQSLDVSVVRHQRYLSLVPHSHEFIEMAVVFKGQCMNEVDGRKIAMSEGDICLIAPGAMHTLEVFDDSTIVMNYLMRTSTFENDGSCFRGLWKFRIWKTAFVRQRGSSFGKYRWKSEYVQ